MLDSLPSNPSMPNHLLYYLELFGQPDARTVLAIAATEEPFSALGRETVKAIGSMGGGQFGNVEVGVVYRDRFCQQISEQDARRVCPALFNHIKRSQSS